jgi:hypothetical protein
VVWPGLDLDPNIYAIVGMSAPDIEIKNGLSGILHARDVVLHPLTNIRQASLPRQFCLRLTTATV